MAAPTIHFFAAPSGTSSSLISVWMPKLHELLLAAGWTLEYADSSALGSSLDPSTPAWDGTPTANTDAGIAVYRMPANGHATEWFVRIRPRWGAATNRPYVAGVTLGTAHDGAGTVTGGGGEISTSAAAAQSDNRQVLLSVSEDGFFILLADANSAVIAHVERARRPDGTVADDIVVLVTFNPGAGSGAVINAVAGIVSSNPPLALGSFVGGPSPSTINYSLASRDASQVVVVGPFWPGGYPVWGPQRLAVLAPRADAEFNALLPYYVDGEQRSYKVAAVAQGNSWATWAVATE